MRIFVFLILLLVLSSPAPASSPGMIEGPPGCDWEAKVLKVDRKKGIELQLQKMQGTCMFEPGNFGQENDKVMASLGDAKPEGYKAGSMIHVWVTTTGQNPMPLTAALKHPDCTRTPIVP